MQGPSIKQGKKAFCKESNKDREKLEKGRKTATGDARLDLVLHDLDVFFLLFYPRVAEVSSLDDTWHSYEKEPHPHFYRLCSRRASHTYIAPLAPLHTPPLPWP